MRRSLRWAAVWLLLAAPALAQAPEDAVVESFELNDAQALVTACTVPAGHALYERAKGFCLGYMTGAMQLPAVDSLLRAAVAKFPCQS